MSPTDRILSLRHFASRIELLDGGGGHLRFVPGELARALVDAASAEIAHSNGKVRSIRLVESAATHLVRIGEPTGRWGNVRFTRWRRLDESGTRVIEFHPRSTYE